MMLERVFGSEIMKDQLGNNEEYGLYSIETVSGGDKEDVEWTGRQRPEVGAS